jgi:hypothetical protein
MTNLTFILWADTHFGYEQAFGEADIRRSALRQMLQLEGWPYPEEIGGVVGTPAFILHGGDVTEGQRGLSYYLHCIKRCPIPIYETLGNHDDDVFRRWFVAKHGAEYYAFDADGVHFVSLACCFLEGGPSPEPGAFGAVAPQQRYRLDAEQMAWLAHDLKTGGEGRPVVIFAHARLAELENRDMMRDLLKSYRVVLAVSGHLHRQLVHQWAGIDCVEVGHNRNHPLDIPFHRTIAVAHITDTRVTVVPWNWEREAWGESRLWPPEAVFYLDKPLR